MTGCTKINVWEKKRSDKDKKGEKVFCHFPSSLYPSVSPSLHLLAVTFTRRSHGRWRMESETGERQRWEREQEREAIALIFHYTRPCLWAFPFCAFLHLFSKYSVQLSEQIFFRLLKTWICLLIQKWFSLLFSNCSVVRHSFHQRQNRKYLYPHFTTSK